MIDDKKIKSAAQGYCDATYGTLNEHPLIAEAFKQGVNWAIQQFLKDLWHSPNEIPEIGRMFIMENHYCDGRVELHSNIRCETFHNPLDPTTQKWFFLDDLLLKEGGKQ